MKKIFAFAALAAMILACSPKSRVDALMAQMTLEEKIGQLNQLVGPELTGTEASQNVEEKIRSGAVGSILNIKGAENVRAVQKIAVEESRLGIPIVFGLDVIHGYETAFPIPLAMACSWDMEAIERASRIAAEEASVSGIAWTFTPMCDIARDPRWGRIAEGAGEDPYLGAAVAAAQVRGFQRDLSDSTCIAACVKHFALYGGAQAGRDYYTVDMSRQQMFNEYMLPYQAAVDAGALTAMSSFNEFESVPLTFHKYLLTDVLRGRYGFEGMLVTDYTAIKECIAHGAAVDLKEGAIKAINAGVDMDMVDESFNKHLAEAVKEGKVSVKTIDQACRRVLELKEKLGLFDDPYRFCREEQAAELLQSDKYVSDARSIADECIVLLKNEGSVLPLKEGARIAVIGPLGDLSKEMLGCWHVMPKYHEQVSVYQGLVDRFGADKVKYAFGSHVFDDQKVESKLALDKNVLRRDKSDEALLAEALSVARSSDVIVATLGELARMSGEGCSRSDITIPAPQRELLKALAKTGKPIVLVTLAGRPLVLDWEDENIPAIVTAWHLGAEAGNAVADVLSGDVNPSGRLTVSFPRSVGQIPIHYNHKNSGRPRGDYAPFQRYTSCYCDVVNAPLYHFGHGLSYSEIEYSDLELSADSLSKAQLPLKVKVKLTNKSGRDAVEVAQLYIHDRFASITRPVKELKGFQRVAVGAGQSVELEFELDKDSFSFYDYSLEKVLEAGDFEIMAGASADDRVLLKKNFRIVE